MEHTPHLQPQVYGLEFLSFGDAWGMPQGYIGVLLEMMEVSDPHQLPHPRFQ